ncbi:MAG: hypothetical protein ACREPM_04435, partial [Gemmatimonadaceae bacterium]
MKTLKHIGLTALLVAAVAGVSGAQANNASSKTSDSTARTDSGSTKTTKISLFRPQEINHIRPADMRGVNMFEAPKEDEVPFSGFALSFGGAFTQ